MMLSPVGRWIIALQLFLNTVSAHTSSFTHDVLDTIITGKDPPQQTARSFIGNTPGPKIGFQNSRADTIGHFRRSVTPVYAIPNAHFRSWPCRIVRKERCSLRSGPDQQHPALCRTSSTSTLVYLKCSDEVVENR